MLCTGSSDDRSNEDSEGYFEAPERNTPRIHKQLRGSI